MKIYLKDYTYFPAGPSLTQFPTPGNEGNHKMSVPFEKLKEDYVLTKTLSAFPSVWWSFKAQPQIPVKLRLEEAECESFFSNRRFRLYSDEIKVLLDNKPLGFDYIIMTHYEDQVGIEFALPNRPTNEWACRLYSGNCIIGR